MSSNLTNSAPNGSCVEESRFCNVPQAGPPVGVFAAMMKAYADDKCENKINLGTGMYRDESGAPWVLPVVQKVKQKLATDDSLNHEYLPVLGMQAMANAAVRLLLGSDSVAIREGRAAGIQSLSGTGSLRVAAEFLMKILKYTTVYAPDPSWENHKSVFSLAGCNDFRTYRYWDSTEWKLDFSGMIDDLKSAPKNSVVILHACSHNPTGIDPSREQWIALADVMLERELFPLFDVAYQGLSTGDLDQDAWAVRCFGSRNLELIACQSFAKNFGLYNERIGNITIVLNAHEYVASVTSQFALIIRAMYSNPPGQGARIVHTILEDPLLFDEWKVCVSHMSSRIKNLRKSLYAKLTELKTPGSWDHIIQQTGIFCYLGLSSSQTLYLIQECHIYMPDNGRINVSWLNSSNLDYAARSIHTAVTLHPSHGLNHSVH